MAKIKLIDIAQVIRSKNSSPFSITLDIIINNEIIYFHIKEYNLINKEKIAKAYNMDLSLITDIFFFDKALAIKINIKRQHSSGSFLDRDVYGAQQHAPLLGLTFDLLN